MPLTVTGVKNARPGRHSDGRGLYLLVKPRSDDASKAGSRSWVLRVQYQGKRRDYGLGSVLLTPAGDEEAAIPLTQRRALTLQDARDKAAIGRALAKAGIDPAQEWRREETIVPTFEVAARQYHGHVEQAWKNGKHNAQWLTTLETYAFPALGAKLVNEIDADAIQAVLLPIWLTIPETARRVRQRIGTVLDFSHSKGWRETDAPMRSVNALMGRIKQPRKGNFKALPYVELPALVARLRAGDISVGRYALQFLILTAARSGEVRGATWGEMDLEAAEWRIPPERMKAGKMHIVPLVPAAIEILTDLHGLFGGKPDEPVFPGMKGQPLSDATLAKVLRVAGAGKATVHGLRSTFRDWAAETGYAGDWAEAALAHGNPDRVEGAYKRTTFFKQRQERLMPAWASYALTNQSNVVSLVEARV